MCRIITIEDGFQYRVHRILKKVYNDYQDRDLVYDEYSFESWIRTNEGRQAIADYFIDDIETYCGLDEALENDH